MDQAAAFTSSQSSPKPSRPRSDWPRAIGALQRLFKNKEDTAEVFEIMFALNGRAYAADFARLLETPEGGRIAYDRVEFADRLLDLAWVAGFPPGSVGAAYLEFQSTQHLRSEEHTSELQSPC